RRSGYLATMVAGRFPGLDVDHASSVASMARRCGPPLKLKSANWLTALDDEVLRALGGRATVLDDVGAGVGLHEYGGGVLVQAGAMPELGDRELVKFPRPTGSCRGSSGRCACSTRTAGPCSGPPVQRPATVPRSPPPGWRDWTEPWTTVP